jgi:hypothetical protein
MELYDEVNLIVIDGELDIVNDIVGGVYFTYLPYMEHEYWKKFLEVKRLNIISCVDMYNLDFIYLFENLKEVMVSNCDNLYDTSALKGRNIRLINKGRDFDERTIIDYHIDETK